VVVQVLLPCRAIALADFVKNAAYSNIFALTRSQMYVTHGCEIDNTSRVFSHGYPSRCKNIRWPFV